MKQITKTQSSWLNPFLAPFYLFSTFVCIALSLIPSAVLGQINRAIYLRDNSDYVEIPHSSSYNFTNNFTLEFWMKADANQVDKSANYNNILLKSYNYSGGVPFGFQLMNSGTDAGKIKVIRKNSANATINNLLSSNRIDDGKFHYIAFVKDSTSLPLKLYVDGVLQNAGVTDITGNINNNNSIYLGRSGEAKNTFSGALDEIKIWKTARTLANIQSDMTSTSASTAVAYYNMETGLKNKGTAVSVNAFLGGNALFFPTNKSYGNALHFDGNNDFVTFNTNLGTLSNQLTIDTWIRPENLTSTQVIATQIGKWELKLVAGKLQFTVNTSLNTTLNIAANNNLTSTEKWQHVAVVFNGNGTANRLELYLNGELENSIALSSAYNIASVGTGMMIGASGSTNSPKYFFSGMMDEFNLWNSIRSADNIITDMNQGDVSANANHLAYFLFDQGSPTASNPSISSLNNVFANGNGLLTNFALSGNRSNWVARAATIAAPNATSVAGNTYHFDGNIAQTGTGTIIGNGFLLSNAAITAYPNAANASVNVAEATLNASSFGQNVTLPGGGFVYKSYVVGTEGLVLSSQSSGPCVTGFPISNIVFSTGSASLSAKWRKVAGATAYDWILTPPNGAISTPDQSGSSLSATDTSVVLKNLDPGSRYYFYVRARCGGGQGEWVGPAFFATQASPQINADSLKNDSYIDVEWALPAAFFVQNAPTGVHLQLKKGTQILYEQPITDYSQYQGESQPTFTFAGNGNAQQYYNVTNTSTWPQLNAWTMETWMKMSTTNTNSLLLFRSLAGTTPFSISIDSINKEVKLGIDNAVYGFANSVLPVEQWFHLAVSFGNGTAVLYIDGLPVGNLSLAMPVQATIGGTYQAFYAANQATMAELRFWNRVRSAEEVLYSKLSPTFSSAAQNNLLLHWKWTSATAYPQDQATTYDGLNNTGELYQIGGGLVNTTNPVYAATPYYSAIHGKFRHYTGPSISNPYRLNGYQIGSGAIINAVYFPPLDTGKTLPYQAIQSVRADSTPFNIVLSWKNKSKMSEFFRIRRTDINGSNPVIIKTISGTDKIDSTLTYNHSVSLADSAAYSAGKVYRFYIDSYSATFNRILDSTKYDVVSLPAINVNASDNLYTNQVNLTWNSLAAFGYQIRIDRDEQTLANLNATATSFTDLYPIYGKRHRYAIILIDPSTKIPVLAGFDRGSVQAKGKISGICYSNIGKYALKNVKMVLTNLTDGTKDTTLTDTNGAFAFNNLYYGQSGDFSLAAYYGNPAHKFLNSPRKLSLSNLAPILTEVIVKDSTVWTVDTTNTGFTLSGFTAVPQNTEDKVNLSWNYSLSVGDTLRINVFRGTELISVLNATSGTSMIISDTSGTPNFVYNYSIYAYKFQGSTIKALTRTTNNVLFPSVTAPTSFTATVSTAQGLVNLSWVHSSQNYQGFRIYRAKQTTNPSPPSDTVLLATVPKGIFTFTDKQTLFGTSAYKYVIQAYRTIENLTVESAKVLSASITYPTLPNLSVLTATATPARNSVNLTWTLPSGSPLNDTSYNFDGYVIYRKKNTPTNSPYELVGQVYKHFPKTFEDKSGLPNLAYTYQVKAFLKNSSPSTKKDTLLVSAGITKIATFPSIKAPISLTLANNVNNVTLNWLSAVSQSGSARNFDGQTVYWKVGTATDSADIPVTQNTYTVYTNTTSATPTTFTVRSYRMINGLKYTSNSISGVGFATGTNPSNLPLPQQFKASQNLPAHIRLSWAYPSYILANFKIYRDGSLIAVLTDEARAYYDYNAANNQNYLYEIEASFDQTTTLKASAIGKRNTLSSVMGRVYANNSKYGLPYVEVSAVCVSTNGNAPYFARTFTDSTGYYRIDNLPSQQSLPITVSVNGANTKFSSPNYPLTQSFAIDGERYKNYTLDFVSDYSPFSKDTSSIAAISYISAKPDPARKQVNIAWTPSNQRYDGFYVYRANSLIGTVDKSEPFIFNDTEGTLGINYLYSVIPYINGANGIVTKTGKTTSATFPSVEPVIYLSGYPKRGRNAVELTWSHNWAKHSKYQIAKNGVLIAEVGVNVPSFVLDTDGIPGQLYNYSVVAADSINGAWIYSSAQTVQVNFPVLIDITELTVQIPDTSAVCVLTNSTYSISRNHTYLQWAYPSECTGFWVYRNGEIIKVLPSGQTNWHDSTGVPGLNTVYQVKAFLTREGVNYSAEGIEKSTLYPVIAAPYSGTFQANPDSGATLLQWKYAEDVIDGFQINRSYRLLLPPFTSYTPVTETIQTIYIDSLKSRQFSFWDKTGNTGIKYHYDVKAFSSRNGITYYSDAAPCVADSVTYPSIPTPVIPSGMTASQVASDGTYNSFVHLRWDYLANNLDGFLVYRGTTLLATIGKGIREYKDASNLTGVFNYRIFAYKWINLNGSLVQIKSDTLADNGNIGQGSTGTPAQLYATQGALVGAVKLNWLGVNPVLIYRDNVQIASLTADNYTDTNVETGKHYIYEVGTTSNTRTSVEGWSKLDGYIEGFVKTQNTNMNLSGAIVEAQIAVGNNTYYYKDTTDANGFYSLSNIYYGITQTTAYLRAYLKQCEAEHIFVENPKIQAISASIPAISNLTFLDLTTYKVRGKVTRQYASCGIDSVRLYARYEFSDGSSFNSTDSYSDKEGNYVIDVNPIQANLVRMTIHIDSIRTSNTSTTQFFKYRFQPKGLTEWTGNALYCLDQLNKLDFEDTLKYPVKVKLLTACGVPITGGRYRVQVQANDVCYDRSFTIDQTSGELTAYLPAMPLNLHVSAVENLTTETQLVLEYLKFRPVSLKLDSIVSLVEGDITDPKWEELSPVELIYHKPPRIVLAQGFEKYLCNDPQKAAIITQSDSIVLQFQVVENFGTDCPVKNGYIKVRNAAAKSQEDVYNTLSVNDQGEFDSYGFRVGNPNLVKPYLYNCNISYYNLSNELIAESNIPILVEGTSQLPGSDVIVDLANGTNDVPLPLYVLRDPPGDKSFSKIEKGSTVKKSISLSKESSSLGGLESEGKVLFGTPGFGFALSFSAGDASGKEYVWEVSTKTTEEIATGTGDLEVGEHADVIVGVGVAMQYGLAKKIKTSADGCTITDSTIFALGPNGVNTTWHYTVGHIKALIAEFEARIENKEQISQGGKLQGVTYSKSVFENKIANWNQILAYHERETLPYYNLCTTQVPTTLSLSQQAIYNQWQKGFCANVLELVNGHWEPKADIVWDQSLVEKYNNAETVLKHIVDKDWNMMPYDWTFTEANLADRSKYIDEQYEAQHGVAAENITFSAGVSYAKSIESAKASTTKFSASTLFNIDGKFGLAWDFEAESSGGAVPIPSLTIAKSDGMIYATYQLEMNITESKEIARDSSNTISYTFEDDDFTDQFSVTVIQGIEPNQTPYFSLLGGRSSCPDEPGTILQDNPAINILKDGAATKYDIQEYVDPNESARFLIQIQNQNPFHSTRDVSIASVLGANRNGAKILLAGAPLTTNTFYNAPPDEPIFMELEVQRGPNAYEYDSLQVVVLGTCYTDPNITYTLTNGDTITFSVHFINPCSDIVLAEPDDNWVIQRRDLASTYNQEALPIKAAGFDVNNAEFQRIYFQYRRIGIDNDWRTIPNSDISRDSLAHYVAANVALSDVPNYWYIWDITDDFDTYPNGDYQLRVVAECLVNGKIVLSYSNKTSGKIDRNLQLIDFPEPSDKVWTYGDEISISFNKDIKCSEIDDTKFVVSNLSNIVNGIPTTVSGKIYCHNNKLSFIPTAAMTTLDGDSLRFVVAGVHTVTGELLNEEAWSFVVQARALYMDKTKFDVQLYQGDRTTLVSHFYNNTSPAATLVYNIRGLTATANPFEGTYSNWFTARNARTVSLAAGTSKSVYFDLNAANLPVGYYTVSFDVDDNAAPLATYQNALTFNLQVLPKPSNWTVNPADFEQSMTINANYKFTNPITTTNTDTSDFISVWMGGELRGVAKVEKIGTYYAAILNVYGNAGENGKALTFRVWDTSTGAEYDATPTVAQTYLKDATVGLIVNPLILNIDQVNDKARYLYLREGWNLFSLNSSKANDSLNKVLASLKHESNGDVIKTATRAATFDSNLNKWVTANNLNLMDIYHGYQMKLANADTLRFTGNLPAVINKDSLFNGWNLIGAPLTVPLSIEDVLVSTKFLSSAQPDDMTLKTISPPNEPPYPNMVAYYKSTQAPKWLYSNTSGMESIKPNYGYWLKVDKNTNLCMSTSACVGTTVLRVGTASHPVFDGFDTQTWQVNPSDYEFNMLITAYLAIDGETVEKEGAKVAAFIGNECRGVGELVYVPELKRYLLTLFVYANTEGETVSFRIYSPQKDRYYAHFENIDFERDALKGNFETPYRFSNEAPDNKFTFEAYPNPFQYKLNIDIVAEMEQSYIVNLCDLMGRVIASYPIKASGTSPSLEIKTDNLDLVEGVYLLHIKGSLGTQKSVKLVYNP